MSDFYDVIFGRQKGKKGAFYTDDEGRVRFTGGPGSGGGTSGGSGRSGGINLSGKYAPTKKDQQSVTVFMKNLPQQGYEVTVSTEDGLTPNIQRIIADRIPHSVTRNVDEYTVRFINPDTGKIKQEWLDYAERALEFLGATPTFERD